MNTYVSLLRGVNVGQNKIVMKDLLALYRDLGHRDVTTYIQSGNVIFKSPVERPLDLARDLEDHIARDLGLAVTVLLRSPDELARVIAGNPFPAQGADPSKLHLTFLADAPDPALVGKLNPGGTEPDEFCLVGREVYLHCPGGYGRTKLNNQFWERRLKLAATTRNWNTVTTLFHMASR